MPKILSVNEDTSQAKLACDHDDLRNLGILSKVAAEDEGPGFEALMPLLQMLLANPLAEAGYSFQGWGGSSNIYERTQDQAAQQEYLKAIQSAARYDAPTYLAMARTFLRYTNRDAPADGITEEAVEDMANKIADLSPFLSMILPGLWDKLHGQSGSAATLTSALMQNSRYSGMTSNKASAIVAGIMSAYRANPGKFNGLGTGEIGDLYHDLVSLGMMPEDPVEAIQTLVKWSGPVAAAYDAGLPGGLESVIKMAPDGVGINWLEPEDLEHRMRISSAINRSGGYAPKHIPTAWGAMSAPEFNEQDAQARGRAMMSPGANRLGAALRLGEVMKFKMTLEESEAVVHGSFVDSQGRTRQMTDASWVDWIIQKTGGRIDQSQAYGALRAQSANQEAAFRGDANLIVRNLQGREMASIIDRYLSGNKRPVGMGAFIMDMHPEIANDRFKRNKAMSEQFGITPLEAETFWTHVDTTLQRAHGTTLQQQHSLGSNTQVAHMKEKREYGERAAINARSGAGGYIPDPIRAFTQSLLDGDELSEALSSAAGFVPTNDLPNFPPNPVPGTNPNWPEPYKPPETEWEKTQKLDDGPTGILRQDKEGSAKIASGIIKLALNKVGLRLGKSDIDGTGLFAGDNFKEGEFIAVGATLKDEEKNSYDISSAARFTNHSLAPNTELIKESGDFKIYAKDRIKIGDELTANYYQVNAVMGPSAKMNWHGEEMPAKDFTKFSGDGLTARTKQSGQDNPIENPRVRFVLPYEEGHLLQEAISPEWKGSVRHAGGGIDEGESAEDAAFREFEEEFGKKLEKAQLKHIGNDPRGKFSKHEFFEILNHGLKPGTYQASNDPNEIVQLVKALMSGDNYLGPDVGKLIKKSDDDVYVQSAVPSSALAMVRKHGLLSAEALLSNPESLAALLAAHKGNPKGVTDEKVWRKRIEDNLKDEFYGQQPKGPSVFFGEPDPDKITDKHPTRRFPHHSVRVNLSKILRDHPKTRIVGTELVPWDPEGPEAQGHLQQYDIDLDKVREYVATDPKELWKHYDDPEGINYAGDVPHGHIITPSGGIDPKYIDIVNLIKKSGLNKLVANAAILSEKMAGGIARALGRLKPKAKPNKPQPIIRGGNWRNPRMAPPANWQRPEGTPDNFRRDTTVPLPEALWSDPSGLRQDGTPWPPVARPQGEEHRAADKYVKLAENSAMLSEKQAGGGPDLSYGAPIMFNHPAVVKALDALPAGYQGTEERDNLARLTGLAPKGVNKMPDGSWNLLDKPNAAMKGFLGLKDSMSTAEWVQRAAYLREGLQPGAAVDRVRAYEKTKWDRYQQKIMRELEKLNELPINAAGPLKKLGSLNKLAENSAVLADLKKAKKESDKGNYAAKTDILRKLLKAFPDEFKTDSENAHVVGLTHKPTNFRIHMPKKALPTKIKEEKQSTGAPKKALPTKAKAKDKKKKTHT